MKKNAATSSSSSSSSPLDGRYLPEDLIADIQRRLTVSCLRRLCCVSKSWNSILSNPKFVYWSLFYGHQNENPNAQILITMARDHQPPRGIPQYVYSCLSYEDHLDATFQKFPDELDRMVGCHGGLICSLHKWYHVTAVVRVGLFNPATGETKLLPPLPDDSLNKYGFRFVDGETTFGFAVMEKGEEVDRYKVVTIFGGFRGGLCFYRGYVFSSDDELSGWREVLPLNTCILPPEIEFIGREIPQHSCTMKKKCYWIARTHQEYGYSYCKPGLNLISFDLSEEVFRVGTTLPFTFSEGSYIVPCAYMVKEETLVVFESEKEFCVLQRVDDVEESWCKLLAIQLQPQITSYMMMNAIQLWKDGRLICLKHYKKILQMLDIITDPCKISTLLLFDADAYRIRHAQIATYIPSNKSLSSRHDVTNH